ncbi:MAG TPA: hypothetical protein GXX28_11465 [Firmicutes bacterium]|nr:hypothetical protein [Bacillota bacterium]
MPNWRRRSCSPISPRRSSVWWTRSSWAGSGQDFLEVGAFSVFYGLLARLGTAELAASQIANQITAVAFMPGFALGAATGS